VTYSPAVRATYGFNSGFRGRFAQYIERLPVLFYPLMQMDAAAVAPAPWRRKESETARKSDGRHAEYLYKLRSARHIVNREPRGQFNASRTPPPPYRVRVLWTRESSGPSRVLRAIGSFIVALNIYLTCHDGTSGKLPHTSPQS